MRHQINCAFPFLVFCAFLVLPLTLSAQCTLSINDAPTFMEGTGGTSTVAFGVSKTGSGPCRALFSTTVVTATGGSTCSGNADYIAQIDQPISLLSNQNSATITVTTCADNRDEPDESFGILLHTPTTGTTISAAALGRITLLDDDPPPDLRINDINFNEGNSNHDASFNVTLSAASAFSITVDFDTIATTATRGDACGGAVDFVRRRSSLTLLPGQTTFELLVPVCGDTSVEPNETFQVVLFQPLSNRVNVADNQGTGTIIDDDLPTVTAQSTQHNEGNAGNNPISLTVTLSAPNPSGASVTCVPQEIGTNIGIKPAQGASGCASGVDFVLQGSKVVFGPTETSKTCTITLCGDLLKESDEGFFVTLQRPQGARVTTATTGVLIKNDD
jgi:hypothetical protein